MPPVMPAEILSKNSSRFTCGEAAAAKWPSTFCSDAPFDGTLVKPRNEKAATPAVDAAKSTVGMLLAPILSTTTSPDCELGVVSTVAGRSPYSFCDETKGSTLTTRWLNTTHPPVSSDVF